MDKGEIASVEWREVDHRIEVAYVEGGPDYLEGSEVVIREMVENEGLRSVAAPEHVRRWERPPRSSDPKGPVVGDLEGDPQVGEGAHVGGG